jgi:hypothetical protein
MVVDDTSEILAPALEEASDRVIRRLSANIEMNPVVRIVDPFKEIPHELPFAYRYQNGQTTLMDRLPLGSRGKTLDRSVESLFWRIDLVGASKAADKFIVLHTGAQTDEAERSLRRLEQYAWTVNVGSDDAAETLAYQLGVGILAEDRDQLDDIY